MAERETRARSKSGTKASVVRQKRSEEKGTEAKWKFPNQRSSKSHGTKPRAAGPGRARSRMAGVKAAEEEETA
ncbi:hypothetical protein NC653_012065 [Populus alba x Populus x berolinensis]|uniref:Uncharacterized protein n=1 Tax=Populus alba x Populus x berolinensis TaxID=444605 RepID=A0AAD6R473_9ROSI|nr:hypothetical protein NC653_012065 [Populus alba x Populus x berolinensis]